MTQENLKWIKVKGWLQSSVIAQGWAWTLTNKGHQIFCWINLSFFYPEGKLGNTLLCKWIPKALVGMTCRRFQWKIPTLANWLYDDGIRTTIYIKLTYWWSSPRSLEEALGWLLRMRLRLIHVQSHRSHSPIKGFKWMANTLLNKSTHPYFYLGILWEWGLWDTLWRKEGQKNLRKSQPEYKRPSPFSGFWVPTLSAHSFLSSLPSTVPSVLLLQSHWLLPVPWSPCTFSLRAFAPSLSLDTA